MRELYLDMEAYYTREQLHEGLARTFGFSEEYGGTLDALYDELCVCESTRLTLFQPEMLVDTLGNYGELVLRVLTSAALENPNFVLTFE